MSPKYLTKESRVGVQFWNIVWCSKTAEYLFFSTWIQNIIARTIRTKPLSVALLRWASCVHYIGAIVLISVNHTLSVRPATTRVSGDGQEGSCWKIDGSTEWWRQGRLPPIFSHLPNVRRSCACHNRTGGYFFTGAGSHMTWFAS
jgi:hypothetical protein